MGTPLPDDVHLYDGAEVRDIYNADRTEKIGEYSIIWVRSEDVTLARLNDWYFNYVAKQEYSRYMILFTDRDDNTGVDASSIIEVDAVFRQDEYGDYAPAGLFGGTLYIPTEEGVLELFMDDAN